MPEKPLESQRQPNDSGWKIQKRVHIMTRRFDFSSYDDMRDFLDDLEALSESEEYYPDLTFSRAHVNVSIPARGKELAQVDFDFSEKIDALADDANSQEKLE